MLTILNEPDHGHAVALARIHDIETNARPVPAGEMVRIVGVAVDDTDALALWLVAWHGQCYAALPEELRPARTEELRTLQEVR
jgi:hypothetical protein